MSKKSNSLGTKAEKIAVEYQEYVEKLEVKTKAKKRNFQEQEKSTKTQKQSVQKQNVQNQEQGVKEQEQSVECQNTNTQGKEKKVAKMANLKHLAEEKKRREGKTPKRISQSTRDILKCIIVLTVMGIVAGALLGVVNFVTYVDADAAIMTQIGEKYALAGENVKKNKARAIADDGAKSFIKASFEVYNDPDDTETLKAVVYHAVGSGAYSGTVELLVFVENDVIADITIYSHSETSGIGTKVFENSYLAKYKGINLKEINAFVRNDNESIQGNIKFETGATKTSNGVNNAVNAVVYAYNNYGGDAL